MKISLISYTGHGHSPWYAADLLIFTKNTRLELRPGLLEEISKWPEEKKMKELEYMSNTIPSSWEFIDYIFMVEDVSRAFTHQYVRNRHGSFAQQTMRITNMTDFDYVTGQSIIDRPDAKEIYDNAMDNINQDYKALISMGVKVEDARGILPTNICTNIISKFNLRTLSELTAKRTSKRTQDEYRLVKDEMTRLIKEVHPWSNVFFRNRKLDAAQRLENFIVEQYEQGDITEDVKIDLLKQVDIFRN